MALVVVPAAAADHRCWPIRSIDAALAELCRRRRRRRRRARGGAPVVARRRGTFARQRGLCGQLCRTRKRCALLADAFLRRNSGFSSVRFFDESANALRRRRARSTRRPDRERRPRRATRPTIACCSSSAQTLDRRAAIWRERAPSRRAFSSSTTRRCATGCSVAARSARRHVALVGPRGRGRLRRPRPPQDGLAARDIIAAAAEARSGARPIARATRAAFALAPIEGSSLGVLMRFDDRRLDAAQRRLIDPLPRAAGDARRCSPSSMRRRSAATSCAGSRASTRAARARGRDPESARAGRRSRRHMPRELRSVAESFNAMADHARGAAARRCTPRWRKIAR